MSPIIFFDGFCVLCNGLVDYLLRVDRSGVFKFASLQGQTAKSMLDPKAVDSLHSIVYLDEEGTSNRSTAVLRIFVRLGGFYKLAVLFFVVPRPIRDAVYDFIARHRYQWFGKREACRLPTPQEKSRLLD